jgi:hypothetical protein
MDGGPLWDVSESETKKKEKKRKKKKVINR